MTARIVLSVLIATLLTAVSASAQSPSGQAPLAGRFVDPANGLSLEQAIARAIEQEPSLRAVRSQVEVAQGAKSQVSLKPNPSVSFEWRDEPGGTDHVASDARPAVSNWIGCLNSSPLPTCTMRISVGS